MTLQKKLKQAATKAAQEAALRERGRCLWLVSDMIERTKAKLNDSLLIGAQKHAAETKMKIAEGLATRLRVRIASGAMPQDKEFEADYVECEQCFEKGLMYHEGQRLCQGCYDDKRLSDAD